MHKAALDAAAGKVWLHIDAAVGMSDGSTRPGIVATHFLNGKQGPDAATDDFGVATLQAHISPEMVRIGDQNTLSVRVRGSIASASIPVAMLEESSALYRCDDDYVKHKDYTSFSEERRSRSISVAVTLSKRDFRDIDGVRIVAHLGGASFGEGVTNADGVCNISKVISYTIKTRYRDSGKQVIDPSKDFPSLSTMVVSVAGFPGDYRIRAKSAS